MSIIVTGDDSDVPVNLTKSFAAFVINPAAEVKAALISLDGLSVIIPTVVCSSAAAGADWVNSLVVVEFSSAETALITAEGDYTLELQVVDGGKTKTWFVAIEAILGHIA